jgi:hypothetical protein
MRTSLVFSVLALSSVACFPLMMPRESGVAGAAEETQEGEGNPASPKTESPSRAGTTHINAATARPAPVAPKTESPVSITIRSKCGKTVKVFYGKDPKFGSGTRSSVSSNSVSSHTFRPGEQFWVVDDNDRGLGNAVASPGTREFEILASCTGIATR